MVEKAEAFVEPRAEGGPERASSPLRVLGRRAFLPYFLGNLLSNNGTWFQNIAQVLLVYRLTGSPFWVGVVNFAQFAAILFLAPVAGIAADRFDRRRLLVTTQLLATALAGTLAGLTAGGLASAPLVISFALALGVTTAFTTPALQSIVPSLVPRGDLSTAVALNAVTFNLARATGPVLGALVVESLGFAWAFGLNAASYVSLAVGVALARPRAIPGWASEGRPRLRDTVRWVLGERGLLVSLVVVAAAGVAIDPVTTLSPAMASRVFGRPDTLTGLLVGAFGAGAVTAAFTVAWRGTTTRSRQGLFLGFLGVGIAVFALSDRLWLAFAGLALAGFGYLSSITAASTRMHTTVEEAHRGRMAALWSMAFHGSRPPASLLDGALASFVGLRAAGLAMAVPAVVVGGALALGRGRLRSSEDTREGGVGHAAGPVPGR